MSIISVEEQYGGRSGAMGGNRERVHVRVFEVVTSDPKVGSQAVRDAFGIPLFGSIYDNGLDPLDPFYESDPGVFVNQLQAEAIDGPEGGGIAWKVTVTYGAFDTAEFVADVTSWKVRVAFGGERTEKVLDFDKDGVPIRNSAKDRFGDPVTVDDHITTMVITRNERVADFDINLASQYSDTINDAVWNGIPARRCKMGIITTSEEQYESNGQYWYYKVTYPVQLGRKEWKKELLDQGYNILDGSGGQKQIRGLDGQPVSDPVALDGAGARLPTTGTPVTLPFKVFDEADWSGLNINLSLRLGL